jgi:hypothetical protein
MSGYRVQDGCWNCVSCRHEVGPDGGMYLRCLRDSEERIVQEAGVCDDLKPINLPIEKQG